jgi:hypothetical protein
MSLTNLTLIISEPEAIKIKNFLFEHTSLFDRGQFWEAAITKKKIVFETFSFNFLFKLKNLHAPIAEWEIIGGLYEQLTELD